MNDLTLQYHTRGKWLATSLCLIQLASGCTQGANSAGNAGPSGRGEVVSSIAFSPDSQALAVGYENLILRVIDPQTGRQVRELKGKHPQEPDRITSVAFSPDGKILACGFAGRFGDAINMWDATTGKMKRFIPQAAQSVAFSPDGKLLAAGGAEWKNQKWSVATLFWDAQNGKLKKIFRRPTEGNVRSISFAPNGETLIMANDIEDPKAQMLTMDVVVSAWNTSSGKMQWSIKEPTTRTPFVAFSPEGKIIANMGGDTVKLRNARTGKLIRTLKTSPTALAFSPDGAILAVGTSESVTLWRVGTGTLLRTLNNHVGPVTSVEYSPNGKLIASGSEDHTVCIWDTRTWKVARTIGKQYKYRPNPFS